MNIVGQQQMSLEDALAHFGVKGMKWGVIRKNIQRNRQLNKATRQRDRDAARKQQEKDTREFDKAIDAARGRISSGSNKRELKEAKANFKSEKQRIGSLAAKRNLQALKDRNWEDRQIASMAKSGKETTNAVLAALGGVALGSAAGAAITIKGL